MSTEPGQDQDAPPGWCEPRVLALGQEAQSGRGPDDNQWAAASAEPKQWGSTVTLAQSGVIPEESQWAAASADPKQWGSTTGGGELGLATVAWG